jgi:glucose/mannose-6-phosphate isomerase
MTSIDPENMRQTVLEWPDLLRRGYSETLDLPDVVRGKRQLIGSGMGGSAIALGVVADLLRGSLKQPYEVVRDYQLPAYVGEETLVIASSYSGSTEETLAAYDQARKVGASVIAVTTGGALAEKAAIDHVPLVRITAESQPRATLPYGIGRILALLVAAGYTEDRHASVEAAANAVTALGERPSEATQLASALKDRLPIVYGAGFLSDTARRLKGQISENAKQTAAFEIVPEQNHNALVGFQFPSSLPKDSVFVLLRSSLEHPRHSVRFTIMKEMLAEHSLPYVELWGSGNDTLAHVSTVSFLGDLASVELAYLNGIDPTPVDIIATLKQKLAEAA